MISAQKRWLWIGLVLVCIAVAYFAFAKPSAEPSGASTGAPAANQQDSSPFVALFAYDLSKKQKAEVEAYLTQKKIEFKAEDRKILVHEKQKDSILLDLASKGIPKK